MAKSPCPDCGSKQIFIAVKPVGAGGGYAPYYLPGLGTFWHPANFEIVLCGDCGLTRFYATPDALSKLPSSDKWRRL